ncbi:MAG TPA: VCBS repeat-containing protein, partial [Chitinophagaceae bacterium]
MRKYLLSGILFCTQVSIVGQETKKLFSLLPPGETGINFRNDIIEDANMFYYKYEYLYIGAGVAAGDINNDGLQDLYFASTLGTNKLYLNLGNFQFKDITEQAGVSAAAGMKTGVNMIDINGDGWMDIVVCKSGPTDPAARTKHVFINNGDLTFTDKAKELGLNDASFSTQSYFFDYDKDG